MRFQAAAHFKPAGIGKAHVEQDKIEGFSEGDGQSRGSRVRCHDIVFSRQDCGQEREDGFVVLDDEHPRPSRFIRVLHTWTCRRFYAKNAT